MIEGRAIAAVAIIDYKSRWPSIPNAAFENLLRQSFGGWMASDSDVEYFPVDVLDYEEDVKRLEQKCLDAEEVAGPYVRCMKPQKCSPTHGGAPIVAYCAHVLGDGSGGHSKAHLASSACIRFWPQGRFSTAIRPMRSEAVRELHDGQSLPSSVIGATNRGASRADATSTPFRALR